MVARGNLTSDGKPYGYVVDYREVTQNLVDALRVYADDNFEAREGEDVAGALCDMRTEIAKLEPSRCISRGRNSR